MGLSSMEATSSRSRSMTVVPTSSTALRPVTRYSAPPPMETRPEDFDLSAGFRLIRRRFRSIAVVAVVLMAAVAPAILSMKAMYHAEARVMVRSLPSTPGLADSGRGDPVDVPSETERLLSRRTAERVIRELNLTAIEEFNPALAEDSLLDRVRRKLRDLIDSSRSTQAVPNEDPIEPVVQRFYRALTIRRDGISNVVQIGFDAQDPLLAAAVPGKVLEVYLDERTAIARRGFEATERFVEQRIAEQQNRVDAAREAVRRYREAVGPVSNEAQAEQVRSVADLNDRYKRIGQRQEDMQASISALQATDRADALQDPGTPDSIAVMQRDIAGQQSALDLLLKTYGENADPVIEARAKLAATTAALGVEIAHYVQSQRAKLAALDREKDETWNALAAAQQKLAQSVVAQTELEGLLGKADTEQAALDKFELERRAMADRAAMPVSDEVEVLSPAAVPLAPQGKSRLFYLLGALFAATSIAITVAFVREMLDRTVRGHEQLAGISGLLPAGLVPVARRRRSASWPATSRTSQDGLFGEAVRSVMVSLRQANGGQLPGSILVTSALDGEGKSFVARSLALELVAARQPALLVDCDLVRGDVGSFLRAGDRPGLNEWLSGEADLADIIYHHEKSGIDFIPRGDANRNQRFHLPDLSAIIRHAEAKGQIVIVDSAPVLASTDTIHLAGQVGRVLIVVRWGKTQLRAVEYTVQRLRETSLGQMLVTLNKVDPRRYKLYGFRDSELFLNSLRKYHLAGR